MRRVILAFTATVAGLVALLAFKTHDPDQSALTPTTSAAAGDSETGTASTTGGTSAIKAPPLKPGEKAVTGNVAQTVYGPVQVQLVEKTGKIVNVNVLQEPTATQEDVQIGQYALPTLIKETLSAQSARIDAVSGASYTSGGYIKSLQSAVDDRA
jgi:uncharacterized protein with FMN-binding domain